MHVATESSIVADPGVATLVFIRPLVDDIEGAATLRGASRPSDPIWYAPLIATSKRRFLGESEAGSYFTTTLPAGEHLIAAWRRAKPGLGAEEGINDVLQATVTAGMVYYIRLPELEAMGPRKAHWAEIPTWLSHARPLVPNDDATRTVAVDDPRALDEIAAYAAARHGAYPARARALHTLSARDGVFMAPTVATAHKLDAGAFIGKTVLYYDASHGNQVEYYDPAGRVFLWYPGNQAVVTGAWRTGVDAVKDGDGVEDTLCFQYGAETYNPVTHQQGGQWSCSPLAPLGSLIVDAVPGDVFDLASGKLPFRLPVLPAFKTIAAVKAAP